jgi:hydrogenase 3 maturation protease
MGKKIMSRKSWKTSLWKTLERLPQGDRLPRIAVVGIGHILRGDDAAGTVLAEILQPIVEECGHVLVVPAGPTPENFCGLLRRFAPDLVLMVDAADMGEAPGALRWLAWQETTGISASTHSLPLHCFAEYLTHELGCEVALLGIQPGQNAIGSPVSVPVSQALQSTARVLSAALMDPKPPHDSH